MALTATHVRSLSVRDIRFPTSLGNAGADAMHPDPDYSCAQVVLYTDTDMKGYGFAFTLGRGTEIVVTAVKSLAKFVVGQQLKTIFADFGTFWHRMVHDSQLRWLGPEKGALHLATSAIINALWDLWAKTEFKPLWQLLVDMEPETLVRTIDFTYITDVLTPEEAIGILKKKFYGKEQRIQDMLATGYPAYTTDAGWIGYSDQIIKQRCMQALRRGFTRFKLKVGVDLKDDKRRCAIVREVIGWENTLLLDACQRWEVVEAINWVNELSSFKPRWIEEPTCCDDIAGHVAIAKAVNRVGVSVATGEHCHNRVMFKQFLSSGGMQVCQLDSWRLGGVNEILAVLLMAAKFNVPVCPHAGGVGLCDLVQHLMFWDYICVTGTTEERMIEHVNRVQRHLKNPVVLQNAHYMPSTYGGYSTSMWRLKPLMTDHEYPTGQEWRRLFAEGKFPTPQADDKVPSDEER